jgi:hypothetical protein
MNVKAKTFLIIVLTLLIGMMVGGLTHRIVMEKRIKRAFSLRNPEHMVGLYEKTLNPDSKQAKQLREILSKHAKIIEELRYNFQEDMRTANQALHEDLDKVLTPAQKSRLQRRSFRPRRPLQREDRGRFQRGGMPLLMEDFRVLRERLSLTDEQIQRLRDIMMRPMPWRDMMPKEGPNLERILEWWKERERAIDKEIAEFLTEEQKKAYALLKQERREKIIKMIME